MIGYEGASIDASARADLAVAARGLAQRAAEPYRLSVARGALGIRGAVVSAQEATVVASEHRASAAAAAARINPRSNRLVASLVADSGHRTSPNATREEVAKRFDALIGSIAPHRTGVRDAEFMTLPPRALG